MAQPAAVRQSRIRAMLPEIGKFCLIGGIGTVIDIGGAAVLNGKFHVEPLAAKAISVTVSTVFTYFGSRYWTFRHRENQPLRREAVLFFVLNVVGLVIAEAVIFLVTYVMGLRGTLDYNAASIIGSGLGTVFRFYAYRKWEFLAPASPAAPLAETAALPDYPPWELDPAFVAAEVSAHVPVGTTHVPAGAPHESPWAAHETRPARRDSRPAPRGAAAVAPREPARNFRPAPVGGDAARRPSGRHRKG
jgi:putative flippase GtrA